MSTHTIAHAMDGGETSAQTPLQSTRAASAAARVRQLLAVPGFIQCPVIPHRSAPDC
jgi:hypothetical protein